MPYNRLQRREPQAGGAARAKARSQEQAWKVQRMEVPVAWDLRMIEGRQELNKAAV